MKINKISLIILLLNCFSVLNCLADAPASFVVGGDINKFYPVVFSDANWNSSRPTELEIGRSNTHQDTDWRGSFMSKFIFHNTRWGNGARFTDVYIKQTGNGGPNPDVAFIAGYSDVTGNSASYDFIIWLKGGGTTYYYKSDAVQNPMVYDNVQHALPYQEINGPTHSYKTTVDYYVNSSGRSHEGSVYSLGGGLNYMVGNLALGTTDTKGFKLAVNGKIRAIEIKVEASNWPDYVFEEGYKIGKLEELESYIKANKHLPDMPKAKDIEANGLELGEMVKMQQKKIEELTLHLISLDKKFSALELENRKLKIVHKKR